MIPFVRKRRQAGRSPNASRRRVPHGIREAFGVRRACSRFLMDPSQEEGMTIFSARYMRMGKAS